MNNVNRTLYIPLYGKAYVSKKHIILHDEKAEEIWEKEALELKGKSKSKWLAYYMAMRAAVYDEWVKQKTAANPDAVVLHIGCGMDSRILRTGCDKTTWYDMDFPAVIGERRKYFSETDYYRIIPADMRTADWTRSIPSGKDAVIVMEGVSMYFQPKELTTLLATLARHFRSVALLMDCYTERAAKASKYKNPINDVGVTVVYGYDNPQELAEQSGLSFVKGHPMTPDNLVDELTGIERTVFRHLFAGGIANSMYKMYEFQTASDTI